MSDFHKELEGKAYQLANGTIDLDEFKSWYQLTMAARVQPSATTEPEAQRAPQQTDTATRRNSEFSDYFKSPYEPMDDDMHEHHRKLMGEGEMKK